MSLSPQKMIFRLLKSCRRAHRKLWLDPQGKVRPKSREKWEAQFKSGHWECLDSLNEALYYMSDPVAVIRSFASELSPRGKLIVSMCRGTNHAVIWQNIEARYREQHRCVIENRLGSISDVKALDAPADA